MRIFLCLFFMLTNIIFSKNIYVVYDDSLSMRKENRYIYLGVYQKCFLVEQNGFFPELVGQNLSILLAP